MIDHLVHARRLVRGVVISKSFKLVGHFVTILTAIFCAFIFTNQALYNYFFTAVAILSTLSLVKLLK